MNDQEKKRVAEDLARAERATRERQTLIAQRALRRAGVGDEAAARDAAELIVSRATDLQIVDGELIGKIDDKNLYSADGLAESFLATRGYFRSAAPPTTKRQMPRAGAPLRTAEEDFAEGVSQPPKPHPFGFQPPPAA